MNRIEKFLNTLSRKQRLIIDSLLLNVILNDLDEFIIKKPKGFKNLDSVRSGKIRIVFAKEGPQNVPLDIDYRKKVYKNL